jgi:AbrB family looped-hinge helix DNA binding protein
MESQKDKKFYGSVTVSERGQIALPVEARKDFNIRTGDKLLVLADLNKGIVITKSNLVFKIIEETLEAAQKMESFLNKSKKRSKED